MPLSNSQVAAGVGIDLFYRPNSLSTARFLPPSIVVLGQGNTGSTYASTRQQITSAAQAAALYGFGSPLHQAARLLFPVDGSVGVGSVPVWVHALQAASGATVATGVILPVGTATKNTSVSITVGGIPMADVAILSGDIATAVTTKIQAAIAAVVHMPVTATDNAATGVGLTSKWKGASANNIPIVVTFDPSAGLSYTITAMNGGAADPSGADVSAALALIGDNWDSDIINLLGNGTGVLTAIQTWGEGRWDAAIRKPAVAYWGDNTAVAATIYAITGARQTDRVNTCMGVPGSGSMPMLIATAYALLSVKRKTSNPARGFGYLVLQGILPGTAAQQWDPATRDLAVKNGLSTSVLQDGVVKVRDAVTHYRPTGEEPPGYRSVYTLNKAQSILYSFALSFDNETWADAPLVPDGQYCENEAAKTPSMALTQALGIVRSLAAAALISSPEWTAEQSRVWISTTNGNRLQFSIPVLIAGNAIILDLSVPFGFYYGQAPSIS